MCSFVLWVHGTGNWVEGFGGGAVLLGGLVGMDSWRDPNGDHF